MKGTVYRNYLIGLLLLILAFNFTDRMALGLVLPQIKHDLPSTLIGTDPVPLKIPDPLSARVFTRRSAVSVLWLGSWTLDLRSVMTASRSAVSPRLGAGRSSGMGPVLLWWVGVLGLMERSSAARGPPTHPCVGSG